MGVKGINWLEHWNHITSIELAIASFTLYIHCEMMASLVFKGLTQLSLLSCIT